MTTLTAHADEAGLHVVGDSEDDTPHGILSMLRPHLSHPRPLVLGDLDVDDGVSTAAWVDVVRHLRDRWGGVTLVEAPQMLAHTLYKVGDLRDGRLELVRPREDEGTTAN